MSIIEVSEHLDGIVHRIQERMNKLPSALPGGTVGVPVEFRHEIMPTMAYAEDLAGTEENTQSGAQRGLDGLPQ